MGFICSFKQKPWVRVLCYPLLKWKRLDLQKAYLATPDSAKLRSMKDIHHGERCFIIGNGPSLRTEDLERLVDEQTFAANRIYEIFDRTNWRPKYYLAIDGDFLYENMLQLSANNLEQMFLSYEAIPKELRDDRIIRILYGGTEVMINRWNDQNAHISEDVSRYFSVGHTVTFAAIQLAVYMGFKEIYLLGVDFNYSIVRDAHGRITKNDSVKDYFSGKRYATTELNYNSTLYAYKQARAYCDAHGIVIRNATRGGKLEVFERVNFDTLFQSD